MVFHEQKMVWPVSGCVRPPAETEKAPQTANTNIRICQKVNNIPMTVKPVVPLDLFLGKAPDSFG